MLVYHSVQLSHTWSDFSRLLRVMISETRILCHFILVLLSLILLSWWSSWHAMLALFPLYLFLVWIFSWRDLFQVTRTDASWVLYIIYSQFKTFEQVMLCSSNCAWFVAFLASPYVVLGPCPYLFLAQFDSSAYVRIQFEFALSCAKLALRSVIILFHRWLSLLLRLKVIASI